MLCCTIILPLLSNDNNLLLFQHENLIVQTRKYENMYGKEITIFFVC
jgi:hypothetical protein